MVWAAQAEAIVAVEEAGSALAQTEPVRFCVGASARSLPRSSVPHGITRFSIPPREQRQVDGGVIRYDPPLEHHATGTRDFQAITIGRWLACDRTQSTVRVCKFA